MRELKRKNYPIPFRGGELSIQANEGAYCTPRSNYGPYVSVEVAHINEAGDMILIPELKDQADDFAGDTSVVHGWVSVERIKELLKSDGYTEENIKGIFDRIDTVVNFK